MPREVWNPKKPSAAFTPTRTPLRSFNPSAGGNPWETGAKDAPLKSSVQEKNKQGGIIGKPAQGITYGQGA